MKDMTGNEYVEGVLKELYVAILFEVIQSGIENESMQTYEFIEEEMEDKKFVTQIRINSSGTIFTEDTTALYLELHDDRFNDDIDQLFIYCDCTDIVIYNIREWYDQEVVPQLKTCLEVAKL